MEEDIQFYIDHASEMMDKSIEHLNKELVKIRAGKAMPSMLDGLLVEYYGTPTPINQVSSINAMDARTLMIKPWEKSVIPDLEKSIINSDLGLNPQNDGEQIIINIPALTEERRIQLVKQVKHEGEQSRISIRNARHEALASLKQLQKDGVSEDDIKRAEDEVQKVVEGHAKTIDDLLAKKEDEIMTV